MALKSHWRISVKNLRQKNENFRIFGQICYFLLICVQIVAPGVQDKHQNRSKHTLPDQVQSYMTLESH